MHHSSIDEIDLERMGEGRRHAQVLESVNRRQRRLLGWGGASIVLLVAATATLTVVNVPDLSGLQVALVCVVVLLLLLTALSKLAAARGRRLAREIEAYCKKEGVSASELRALVDGARASWPFAVDVMEMVEQGDARA